MLGCACLALALLAPNVWGRPGVATERFSARDGKVIDGSGAEWNVWGTSNRRDRLEFVSSFDVMWFAWYAFHPETEVLSE